MQIKYPAGKQIPGPYSGSMVVSLPHISVCFGGGIVEGVAPNTLHWHQHASKNERADLFAPSFLSDNK